MKKILYSLLLLLITIIFIPNTYAYETVDNKLKVYDFNNLLSSYEKASIKTQIDTYTSKYNMDMVVVVKKDYTGSLKSYAQDFYDYNKFGIGKTYDGIILVLNYDYLGIDCYIATTGKAILYYDDARISNLKSEMSAVKNESTYTVVSAFINKASSQASNGIPASNRDYYIDENGEYKHKKVYPIAIPIVSLVVSLISLLVMLSKNKMIRTATQAKEYLDKSSVNITAKRDVFINTHTSKVNISSQSSGGHGGSSVSRGSSGRSHGGGGGRL